MRYVGVNCVSNRRRSAAAARFLRSSECSCLFCRANFLLSVVDVEWPAFVQLCTFHAACRGPSSTMDVMSVMLSESRKVAITSLYASQVLKKDLPQQGSRQRQCYNPNSVCCITKIAFFVQSAHVPIFFVSSLPPPPDFSRNGDAFLRWCSIPVATTIAPP